MARRIKRWTGALITLALAACGDDTVAPRDAAGDSGEVSIDRCAAPERFFVTAVAPSETPCIGEVPVAGDTVVLSGGRLRIGEHDLALTAVDEACVAAASACELDLADGDRAEVSASFDLRSGHIELTGELIEAFRAKTCTPVTLEVTAIPDGCFLGGRYRTTAADLTGGSCDLTWAPAEVLVSVPDPTLPEGVLRWGGQSYDIVAVDASTCSVTATSGFAFYNGVARTTRITATFVDGRASFAIEDALEGPSDFDEICVAARFTASGEAVAPGTPEGVTAWAPSCEALPFLCGDGVCATDGGEQCWICEEDCGCAGATSCVGYVEKGAAPNERDFGCAAPCAGGGCSDETRCVAQQELDVYWYGPGGAPNAVCMPATDDIARGGPCTDTRDCAAGLACADGQCLARCADVDRATCGQCRVFFDLSGDEMCVPRCSPDETDQCGAGTCAGRTENQFCSSSDGGIEWFCHPSDIRYACTPTSPPAFGGACPDDGSCGVDGGCVETQCTRTGNTFDCAVRQCSRPCESDADCAAPLTRCSTINGIGGSAPSRWCMAGP